MNYINKFIGRTLTAAALLGALASYGCGKEASYANEQLVPQKPAATSGEKPKFERGRELDVEINGKWYRYCVVENSNSLADG